MFLNPQTVPSVKILSALKWYDYRTKKFMKSTLFFLTILISGVSFSQTEPNITDSIIEFINYPAQFPKGHNELSKFILDNFDYGDIDSTKFDFGTLYLTFWVEKDGSITGVDLMNRHRESIRKKEATPFKSMSNWIPACDRNGPIRDRIWFPIIIDP